MVENIREIIYKNSVRLFNERGYSYVTMREIAAECGISVGNLTYYYPKKEDLLMLEHDGIMQAFIDEVLLRDSKLSGLDGYFTVECAFLYYIVCDAALERLYRDVINIPGLRRRYCESHYELYCRFVSPANPLSSKLAIAAMSGVEFELVGEGLIRGNEVKALAGILGTLLIFEGKSIPDNESLITSSITRGLDIATAMANKGLKF